MHNKAHNITNIQPGFSAEEISRLTAKRKAGDPEYARSVERTLAASQPILEELRKSGYVLRTLAELRHLGRDWKSAIPVLLRWLPATEVPEVKEEIVRCLSVPWVRTAATEKLINEFEKTDPASSLAWAIGNALSIVDIAGYEEPVVELAKNPKYGTARQMLVLGLGRLQTPNTEGVLLDLLGDEQVKLHAVIALAKRGSQRALPKLEELLNDKRAVIRKEARKAITRIARRLQGAKAC